MIKIGDQLKIQCYKHNGKIHRHWNEAVIIDIKKDYIICSNNRTLVIESDGSTRKTREPAVMYFFKNSSIKDTPIICKNLLFYNFSISLCVNLYLNLHYTKVL